jgi:hypothetical protein
MDAVFGSFERERMRSKSKRTSIAALEVLDAGLATPSLALGRNPIKDCVVRTFRSWFIMPLVQNLEAHPSHWHRHHSSLVNFQSRHRIALLAIKIKERRYLSPALAASR